MNQFSISQLVEQAKELGGNSLCSVDGHDWQTDGGRCCPKGHEDCSQPVYVCGRCGLSDYGDRGGPAYHECFNRCHEGYVE